MSENEISLYDELTSPMSYDEDYNIDNGSGSGSGGDFTDTYELYFNLNRIEGVNLLHSDSDLRSILSIRYKSNNIEYDATSEYCTYSVISSNTYGYLLKINVKSYSSPLYIHFNGTIMDGDGISWNYPSSSDIIITAEGGVITSAMRGSLVYSDNTDGFTGVTAADPYRILFGDLMTKTPSGQISIHLPSTTGSGYGEVWDVQEYGEIEFVEALGNSNTVTCEKLDSDNSYIFNIYMSDSDKAKDVTLKFKMVEEPYKTVSAVVNLSESYNHTLVINPKEHHIHFKWNIQDIYGPLNNTIDYEIAVVCADFQEVVMSSGSDVNNYKNYITFDWNNVKDGYVEFDIYKKPANGEYIISFQEKGCFEDYGAGSGATLYILNMHGDDEFDIYCDTEITGYYTECDKTLNPNANDIILTSTVDYDFVTCNCKYWLYCSYGTDPIPLLKDDLVWVITDEEGKDMSSHVLIEDSIDETLLTITTRKPLSFTIKPTFWDVDGYNSYSFNVPYNSNYDTYANSNYSEYVYLPEFKDQDHIDFENYKIQDVEVVYTTYLTLNEKILNSYGITPSFSFANGSGLETDDFIKSYNYNSSTGYLKIITNQATDFEINISFSKYISDYKLNVYYNGSESQNLGTILLDNNLSYTFYVYGVNTEGDNISRDYLTFDIDSDSSLQYTDNVNIIEYGGDGYKVTVNGYTGNIGYFMTNYSLPINDSHADVSLCSYGHLNVSFDDFHTVGSTFDLSLPDPKSVDYIKFTDVYNNAWDNNNDGVLNAVISEVTIYQTPITPSLIENYASISKIGNDTFAITSNFLGDTIYPYGGHVSIEVSATNPESNIEYTKKYSFNRFDNSIDYKDNPIVEPFNTFYNEDAEGYGVGSGAYMVFIKIVDEAGNNSFINILPDLIKSCTFDDGTDASGYVSYRSTKGCLEFSVNGTDKRIRVNIDGSKAKTLVNTGDVVTDIKTYNDSSVYIKGYVISNETGEYLKTDIDNPYLIKLAKKTIENTRVSIPVYLDYATHGERLTDFTFEVDENNVTVDGNKIDVSSPTNGYFTYGVMEDPNSLISGNCKYYIDCLLEGKKNVKLRFKKTVNGTVCYSDYYTLMYNAYSDEGYLNAGVITGDEFVHPNHVKVVLNIEEDLITPKVLKYFYLKDGLNQDITNVGDLISNVKFTFEDDGSDASGYVENYGEQDININSYKALIYYFRTDRSIRITFDAKINDSNVRAIGYGNYVYNSSYDLNYGGVGSMSETVQLVQGTAYTVINMPVYYTTGVKNTSPSIYVCNVNGATNSVNGYKGNPVLFDTKVNDQYVTIVVYTKDSLYIVLSENDLYCQYRWDYSEENDKYSSNYKTDYFCGYNVLTDANVVRNVERVYELNYSPSSISNNNTSFDSFKFTSGNDASAYVKICDLGKTLSRVLLVYTKDVVNYTISTSAVNSESGLGYYNHVANTGDLLLLGDTDRLSSKNVTYSKTLVFDPMDPEEEPEIFTTAYYCCSDSDSINDIVLLDPYISYTAKIDDENALSLNGTDASKYFNLSVQDNKIMMFDFTEEYLELKYNINLNITYNKNGIKTQNYFNTGYNDIGGTSLEEPKILTVKDPSIYGTWEYYIKFTDGTNNIPFDDNIVKFLGITTQVNGSNLSTDLFKYEISDTLFKVTFTGTSMNDIYLNFRYYNSEDTALYNTYNIPLEGSDSANTIDNPLVYTITKPLYDAKVKKIISCKTWEGNIVTPTISRIYYTNNTEDASDVVNITSNSNGTINLYFYTKESVTLLLSYDNEDGLIEYSGTSIYEYNQEYDINLGSVDVMQELVVLKKGNAYVTKTVLLASVINSSDSSLYNVGPRKNCELVIDTIQFADNNTDASKYVKVEYAESNYTAKFTFFSQRPIKLIISETIDTGVRSTTAYYKYNDDYDLYLNATDTALKSWMMLYNPAIEKECECTYVFDHNRSVSLLNNYKSPIVTFEDGSDASSYVVVQAYTETNRTFVTFYTKRTVYISWDLSGYICTPEKITYRAGIDQLNDFLNNSWNTAPIYMVYEIKNDGPDTPDTPSYAFIKTINVYKNGEATDESVVFNVEYRKDAITNEEYTFEDVEANIGFVPFNNITIKSKVNRPIRVRCSLISDPTCFGWVTVDKNSEDGLKLNMISNIVYKPADITTTNSTGKSIINFSNKSVIKKTFKIPGYKPITLWVDNNTPKLKLHLEREIGVMNEDYSIELTNLPTGTYTLKYEDENGNVLTNYDSLTKNYSI